MCRSGCGWDMVSSVCGRLRGRGRRYGIDAGVAAALTVAVVLGLGGWGTWVGQPAWLAASQPAQAVWLEANQRAASVASGQPADTSQPPSSQPC